MKARRIAHLAAVAVLLSGTAMAQQAGDVAFSADELARILAPAESSDTGAPVLKTRGLRVGNQEQEQEQASAQPAPGQAGSGVVPNLQINFEFNSADLTPDSTRQLDALGQALNMEKLSALRFVVGGHTDAQGSDAYNQQLSQQRADSVARYLQSQHGINPSRLSPIGFGETDLADPANPASGVNRRVEIRTEG